MSPKIDTAVVAAFAAYTVAEDSLVRMDLDYCIYNSVAGKDTALAVFAVAVLAALAAFAVVVFVEIVKVADMEDKGIDGGPVACAAVAPVAKAVAAGMAYYDNDRADFALAVVEPFSENLDRTAVMPQTDLDLFGMWVDCFDLLPLTTSHLLVY